jgi:glycosyltransferase involved in cell wall biosynthesis
MSSHSRNTIQTTKAGLRVLCLSFWAPPLVRPQAILIGKMIPELVRQGVEPIVVTYENCGEWNVDASVYTIPPFSVPKGLFVQISYMGFISQLRYFRNMRQRLLPLIKKHDINLIYSFANPQDSNIIAAMLARKTGITLVTHFCDPWYDNPYKTFSRLGRLKVLFWENYIVRSSKKVTITNESARRLIMRKFKKPHSDKGVVIPHCFDPSDYPQVAKHNDKFILSYIGAFYKPRNPELLFSVLQDIFRESPGLQKDFILRLVGTTNIYAGYSEKVLRLMLGEYGLLSCAEIIPAVPYKESLGYMKEADLLVVIDANFPGSPFLPSKLIDYAGSGTPIVGITPKDSPTALVLQKLGYSAFCYNEREELKIYLSKVLQGAVSSGSPVLLSEFSVTTTVKQLIEVFKESKT